MKTLLLLLSLLSVPYSSAEEELPTTVGITLSVENIRVGSGTLWIGVYESQADFLDRDRARLVYHKVTRLGTEQVYIDGLVAGKTYALGIFHDENDNGELDTNLLGLPSEPWALSRPLRSLLRKPRFEEMSFVLDPREGMPVLRLR